MENQSSQTELSRLVNMLGSEPPADSPATDTPAGDVETEDVEEVIEGGEVETELPGKQPADTETGEEETETETETTDPDPDEGTSVLAITVNGTEETFDLNEEAQRNKLIEFAQKGRHYSVKMDELKTKEKVVDDAHGSIISAVKLMYAQKLNEQMGALAEGETFDGEMKPLEYFKQIAHSDREAVNMYLAQKEKFNRVQEYASNFMEATKQFEVIKNDFADKHPEIEDVNLWISENLNPYVQSIASYGEKPIAADTLDMIYFWKNREKEVDTIKRNAVKDFAKTKPVVKKNVKYNIGGKKTTTTKAQPQEEHFLGDVMKQIRVKQTGRISDDKILIHGIID